MEALGNKKALLKKKKRKSLLKKRRKNGPFKKKKRKVPFSGNLLLNGKITFQVLCTHANMQLYIMCSLWKKLKEIKTKGDFRNFYLFGQASFCFVFVSLHSAEAGELLDHWISDSLIILLPVCLTENNAFIKIVQIYKYTNAPIFMFVLHKQYEIFYSICVFIGHQTRSYLM